MRIKLAILEKDEEYLRRITSAFERGYSDKLEVFGFTDETTALNSIQKQNIDVFLVNECFSIQMEEIGGLCGFAYLVDSSDVQSLREQRAIGKYQMVDQIYKQILDIFAENNSVVTSSFSSNSGMKIIVIVSAAGGVGSSTVASSLAHRLALEQRSVLYLDLQTFSSVDNIFTGNGTMNMSDLIYALKGKNNNIQFKLQSIVEQDQSGVCYVSGCKNALDIEELNSEDIEKLVQAIDASNTYGYLVIDSNFSFKKEQQMLLSYADTIIMISDGTEIANVKTMAALDSLEILDQHHKNKVIPKVRLLYNRFGSKTGQLMNREDVITLGGIPKFEGIDTHQLAQQIATMAVLDDVIQI